MRFGRLAIRVLFLIEFGLEGVFDELIQSWVMVDFVTEGSGHEMKEIQGEVGEGEKLVVRNFLICQKSNLLTNVLPKLFLTCDVAPNNHLSHLQMKNFLLDLRIHQNLTADYTEQIAAIHSLYKPLLCEQGVDDRQRNYVFSFEKLTSSDTLLVHFLHAQI